MASRNIPGLEEIDDRKRTSASKTAIDALRQMFSGLGETAQVPLKAHAEMEKALGTDEESMVARLMEQGASDKEARDLLRLADGVGNFAGAIKLKGLGDNVFSIADDAAKQIEEAAKFTSPKAKAKIRAEARQMGGPKPVYEAPQIPSGPSAEELALEELKQKRIKALEAERFGEQPARRSFKDPFKQQMEDVIASRPGEDPMNVIKEMMAERLEIANSPRASVSSITREKDFLYPDPINRHLAEQLRETGPQLKEVGPPQYRLGDRGEVERFIPGKDDLDRVHPAFGGDYSTEWAGNANSKAVKLPTGEGLVFEGTPRLADLSNLPLEEQETIGKLIDQFRQSQKEGVTPVSPKDFKNKLSKSAREKLREVSLALGEGGSPMNPWQRKAEFENSLSRHLGSAEWQKPKRKWDNYDMFRADEVNVDAPAKKMRDTEYHKADADRVAESFVKTLGPRIKSAYKSKLPDSEKMLRAKALGYETDKKWYLPTENLEQLDVWDFKDRAHGQAIAFEDPEVARLYAQKYRKKGSGQALLPVAFPKDVARKMLDAPESLSRDDLAKKLDEFLRQDGRAPTEIVNFPHPTKKGEFVKARISYGGTGGPRRFDADFDFRNEIWSRRDKKKKGNLLWGAAGGLSLGALDEDEASNKKALRLKALKGE